jgi:hypothetical protein
MTIRANAWQIHEEKVKSSLHMNYKSDAMVQAKTTPENLKPGIGRLRFNKKKAGRHHDQNQHVGSISVV